MATHKLSILVEALGAQGAAANIAKLDKSLSGVGKSAGGALSHAKGQISGLLGSVGLLAGGAGLLGVGAAFTATVNKARDFGDAVDQIANVTGLSAEKASALAATFEHFGVSTDTGAKSLGMLEKNLSLYTLTAKKATEFQKTYGLALVDSSGHVKDANQLLLDSAAYYNNSAIPAQTKAAALAKLYGRSWMDLVDVFEQGAPAIQAARLPKRCLATQAQSRTSASPGRREAKQAAA